MSLIRTATPAAPRDPVEVARDDVTQQFLADELRLCGAWVERLLMTGADRAWLRTRARQLADAGLPQSHAGLVRHALGRLPGMSDADKAGLFDLARAPETTESARMPGPALVGVTRGVGIGASASANVSTINPGTFRQRTLQTLRFADTVDAALARLAMRTADPERVTWSFAIPAPPVLHPHAAASYLATCADSLRAIGRWSATRQLSRGGASPADGAAARPGHALLVSGAALLALGRAEAPAALHELRTVAVAQGVTLLLDEVGETECEDLLNLFATELTTCPPGVSRLGLTVKASSRRAIAILKYLREIAQARSVAVPVRLVRGRCWSRDMTDAVEGAWSDYPVVTAAHRISASFMACARLLLSQPRLFHAQLVPETAAELASAELLGAGRDLDVVTPVSGDVDVSGLLLETMPRPIGVRREAWVGEGAALLGAWEDICREPLIRARQTVQRGGVPETLEVAHDEAAERGFDPVGAVEGDRESGTPSAWLRAPNARMDGRFVTAGEPLADRRRAERLMTASRHALDRAGVVATGLTAVPHGPWSTTITLPEGHSASLVDVAPTLDVAQSLRSAWRATPCDERMTIVERALDALAIQRIDLIAMAIIESGLTHIEAERDWRAAIDGVEAVAEAARGLPQTALRPLPGGVVALLTTGVAPISSSAIGIAKAALCGNVVVTVPHPAAARVAGIVAAAFRTAGMPAGAAQVLPLGIADSLVLAADPAVTGIAIECDRATLDRLALARLRAGAHLPVIDARLTGPGIAIVDASADVAQAAFDIAAFATARAGQASGAVRMVFAARACVAAVRDEISHQLARRTLAQPFAVDPAGTPAFEIGPMLDGGARTAAEAEKMRLSRSARLIADRLLPDDRLDGCFVTPALYEIDTPFAVMPRAMGPMVVLAPYDGARLEDLINTIGAVEDLDTVVLHSRRPGLIDALMRTVTARRLVLSRTVAGPHAAPHAGLVAADRGSALGRILSGSDTLANSRHAITVMAPLV